MVVIVESQVPNHYDSLCPPWDYADPELIQAIAETELLDRDKDLPRIIGIVKGSEVPPSERIGYPAYTPLNFYDNLADQTNPDGYLDSLDFSEVRGDLPEGAPAVRWPMWRLPAHGSERTKYQCGRFLISKTYGCPAGHEIYPVRCSCNRLDCPTCYPDKVRRMADHISMRLRVVDQLYDGPAWYHIVVSPPQDLAVSQCGTVEGFGELRRACLDVVKRAGINGGAWVFHPYRQNDGSDTWRAGPHFHMIVNGWLDSSKVPSGWVVKNVREVPVSGIFPVAYYLCSHAGVGSGGVNKNGRLMSIKSVSYFGNCGTNNNRSPVKLREETDVSTMKCGTCDYGLYRYREYLAMLRGSVTYVPPLVQKSTVTAWCIKSDLDGLRLLTSGLSMGDIATLGNPRIYVQYPEPSHDLTSKDVEDIDGMISDDSKGPSGPRRAPEVPRIVVPRLPGAPSGVFVPSSPGPGGGRRDVSPGAVRDA